MTKKYEIYSRRRIVSTQESVSSLHAVFWDSLFVRIKAALDDVHD